MLSRWLGWKSRATPKTACVDSEAPVGQLILSRPFAFSDPSLVILYYALGLFDLFPSLSISLGNQALIGFINWSFSGLGRNYNQWLQILIKWDWELRTHMFMRLFWFCYVALRGNQKKILKTALLFYQCGSLCHSSFPQKLAYMEVLELCKELVKFADSPAFSWSTGP